MLNEDVIPSKDAEFDSFQENLLAKVTLNQLPWNIPLVEITAVQALQTPWTAAWNIAKHKTNRTQTQVEAKDDAREDYEDVLRPFIQKWIVLNATMTDANREACGIRPRDDSRTPVPDPTTLPQVDTKPQTGHVVKVFFKQEPDAQGISRRGKPKGVAFIEFVFKIGGPAPATPAECPERKLESRSPVRASFESGQKGVTVYLFARWLNSRGKGGPWTDRQEFMVP